LIGEVVVQQLLDELIATTDAPQQNERAGLVEKGALALAATFPHAPARLSERAAGAFTALTATADDLQAAIEARSRALLS
jgi:hypothetical protein